MVTLAIFFRCRVSGGELFERIVEEDYLMEEDAIDYVRQVLEGLKYMHSKSIVHLDLKVRSIFFFFFCRPFELMGHARDPSSKTPD